MQKRTTDLLASIGGVLLVLGVLLFLYGNANYIALNIISQFGYTMPATTYAPAMAKICLFQFGGGLLAVIGGALAFGRK